jgi:hypothetical protein
MNMEIDVYSASELPMVLHVLRTALRSQGPLDDRERSFLSTYADIAGVEAGPGEPQALTAAGLQGLVIEGARGRKRLVQLAAMAVLFNRPVRPASFQFLRELARHLGTHDEVIDVIGALLRGRRLQARLLTLRRGMRNMLGEAFAAEGAKGVLRFLGALLLGARVNKNKLLHYKRLGLLPEGTLGREYWKHMTEQGFGFPGEPRGIAETVAYHDVAHVLAGHDATPIGEIQQGCFQGGNRRRDGFSFVQFVILHFRHGIQITPAAPPEVGHFDPEKVLWAIQRGAQCRVDMTHQWDYWPLMPLPLQEARARCELQPLPLHLQGASQ